jgi:hypothetical protein
MINKVIFTFIFTQIINSLYGQNNFSLRFYGNGSDDIDRVKISIDNPERPMDVGSGDFTVEFWMRAFISENNGTVTTGNDGWITGNIIFDRDIFGSGDYGDYGISIGNNSGSGILAFGVNNGSSGQTIIGSQDVADGIWHHVAVTRRYSDGLFRIYVDGQLDTEGNGPTGNISYRDGRSTAYTNDPFLVLGAEKHDAGSLYPSYSGWLDEIRLSTILRYNSNFTLPNQPFTTDGNTVGLYHLDEGSGDVVNDISLATGGPSNGIRRYGGSPAGPVWSTETPFGGVNESLVVGDIPDQSVLEGSVFMDIVLDNYVSDPDHSDSLLVWSYSGNSELMVSIDADRIARVGIPDTNWNGSEMITFSVTDPGGLWDSDSARFTVTGVNDPPRILSNFPNPIEFDALESFIFDLDSCVADVDDPIELLVWKVFDSSAMGVYINQTTHLCSVYYKQRENNVSDTLAFTVTDTDLASDTIANIIVKVNVNNTAVWEGENLDIPIEFELGQNYPNPFNSTTRITFGLPRQLGVRIEIYNTAGQRIKVIFDDTLQVGRYECVIDLSELASGIYFYSMKADGFKEVRKMLQLK